VRHSALTLADGHFQYWFVFFSCGSQNPTAQKGMAGGGSLYLDFLFGGQLVGLLTKAGAAKQDNQKYN
jgi:hypothetical protein